MKPPSLPPARTCAAIVLTLLLGAAGGAVAVELTAPLPWLIGALLATMCAALGGAPLRGPGKLHAYMATVLGVMLGSGFTPDILNQMAKWPISLSGVFVYTATITTLLTFAFYRWGRFGFTNSFFAAAPGGLVEMIALAKDYNGDVRQVSLMHSVRLCLTVLIIPFWYRFFQGYEPGTRSLESAGDPATVIDIAVLVACAVVGYLGGRKIRLPAHAVLGPLILSALAHITGLTSAHLPDLLINTAQIVFGTALGCQFIGVSVRDTIHQLRASAIGAVVMISLAAVFALTLERITGFPFQALLLAFAPGGLAEMTLITLAMNIDVAFVSSHHVVRVIFLMIVMPVTFTWLATRFGIKRAHDDADERKA